MTKKQTQYPLNASHALADSLKYFIHKLGVSDEIVNLAFDKQCVRDLNLHVLNTVHVYYFSFCSFQVQSSSYQNLSRYTLTKKDIQLLISYSCFFSLFIYYFYLLFLFLTYVKISYRNNQCKKMHFSYFLLKQKASNRLILFKQYTTCLMFPCLI